MANSPQTANADLLRDIVIYGTIGCIAASYIFNTILPFIYIIVAFIILLIFCNNLWKK